MRIDNQESSKLSEVMAVSLILACGMCSQASFADMVIHTTGIVVDADASSTPAASGGLELGLDTDFRIAVDGTFFLTPKLGLNVLATTLNFEVDSAGTSLGSVSVLPPIITLQYHFKPDDAKFRPYLGVGFNYNMFYDESGLLAALDATVEDTVGFVVGSGFDMMLSENLSINADLKYLTLEADVDVAGVTADVLDVDALIIGIGFGFHF